MRTHTNTTVYGKIPHMLMMMLSLCVMVYQPMDREYPWYLLALYLHLAIHRHDKHSDQHIVAINEMMRRANKPLQTIRANSYYQLAV